MDVSVTYEKAEIHQDYFHLNRDFMIHRCSADDRNYDFANNMEIVSLGYIDGYKVKKYILPPSFTRITIEYTAYLSGKTGAWPYVRETISPEFTFIWFETFCYPIFFTDDRKSLIDFLHTAADVHISAAVPDEFIIVSDAKEVGKSDASGVTTYEFIAREYGFNTSYCKIFSSKIVVW